MVDRLNIRPTDDQIEIDFRELRHNTYPGRLALQGVDEEGNLIQGYALMGRSESSQRRLFVAEHDGNIRTVASDKSETEMQHAQNAELIYYQASDSADGIHVVSNGAQTKHIVDAMTKDSTFEHAIHLCPKVPDGKGGHIDLSLFEPDNPNYTPRIATVIDENAEGSPSAFGFAVVRKAPNAYYPIYQTWGIEWPETLPKGVGYAVHTYASNAPTGKALPSFSRDHPLTIPLEGTQANIASQLWNVLDSDNRVAVMVRTILDGEMSEPTIINRHQPYAGE